MENMKIKVVGFMNNSTLNDKLATASRREALNLFF
jgi:hypothetical protein